MPWPWPQRDGLSGTDGQNSSVHAILEEPRALKEEAIEERNSTLRLTSMELEHDPLKTNYFPFSKGIAMKVFFRKASVSLHAMCLGIGLLESCLPGCVCGSVKSRQPDKLLAARVHSASEYLSQVSLFVRLGLAWS